MSIMKENPNVDVTELVEITHSWKEIYKHVCDGSYKKLYRTGYYKKVDLGREGVLYYQFIFDKDTDIHGHTAEITCIPMNCLNTVYHMNPWLAEKEDNDGHSEYCEGTGAIGGYVKSDMKRYLDEVILPLYPEDLRSIMSPVEKKHATYDTQGDEFTQKSEETLWIPSYEEVKDGGVYKELFDGNKSRIKPRERFKAIDWSLRSAASNSYFSYVSSNGTLSCNVSSFVYGVVPCFCISSHVDQMKTKNMGSKETYGFEYTNEELITAEQYKEDIRKLINIFSNSVKEAIFDCKSGNNEIILSYTPKELHKRISNYEAICKKISDSIGHVILIDNESFVIFKTDRLLQRGYFDVLNRGNAVLVKSILKESGNVFISPEKVIDFSNWLA